MKKNNIIEKINDLLKKDKDVTIVESIKEGEKYYKGRIEVVYLKETLIFDIEVPYHYPLTHPNSDNISIIFRNKDYIGLNHINLDGSVCFHPDKDDDFDRKFNYELSCLKQWIRDYYIYKKEDDNYTLSNRLLDLDLKTVLLESLRIDESYYTYFVLKNGNLRI